MGKNGEKSIDDIIEEDIISQLPNSLLCEILQNLTTKDVIKTSLLCSRWRNLWQIVPALDLDFNGTIKDNAKFEFLNRFIDLNTDLCLHRVKLRNVAYGYNHVFAMSTNIVLRLKVEHLDILGYVTMYNYMYKRVEIPPTIYTKRLVSLKLNQTSLPKLPKSVSLPCLKTMDLEEVSVDDNLGLEMLISCVKDLTISSDILTVIYKLVKLNPLTQFSKLSCLSITDMTIGSWECLLVFLQSCPNLKSLVMGFENYRSELNFWDVPHCVLSSLEFVEIRAIRMAKSMKKLGSYFISSSTLLAKLTLCLDHIEVNHYAILDELFVLPRRSNACEVVVRSRQFGTYKPLSLLSLG